LALSKLCLAWVSPSCACCAHTVVIRKITATYRYQLTEMDGE
jgi:hypothetical protein